MGARYEPGSAHGPGDLVRIVHDLQIKGLSGIDGGVLVGMLADALATLVIGRWEGDVQEVMVKDRSLAHQTADGTGHQGQV